MNGRALKIISVFLVAGIFSAALSLLLGWLYLPSLFFLAGLALFLGLATAYSVARACRWLGPARSRARYWEALALIVLGYPVAELFGTIMSLFCEAVLFVLPHPWHATLKSYEPVPMIGLLSFWGSLAAAFCVNTALMVMSERWSNRTLLLLSIAGTVTTIVAMAVYAPNYAATEGFAAKYRELVLFGVLLPLGDVLFSVIAGYTLATATPAERVEGATPAVANR